MDNEKIRVFISSSMNDEHGIHWLDIRRNLKILLESNPLLKVFEIENRAATRDPESVFLNEVTNSNLVILLVGSVIRSGTYAEYQRALELKVPLLVYFDKTLSNIDGNAIDPKVTMDAKHFKNELIADNRETFNETNLLDFNGNNILRDTLDEIRSRYVVDVEGKAKYSKIVGTNNSNVNFTSTLSLFEKNKDNLYDTLFQKHIDIKDNEFGLKSINWLLQGSDLPSVQEYINFVKSEKSLGEFLPIIQERWRSFLNNMDRNYELATTIESNVLQNLDDGKKKVPEWLVDDVLIDCRNLYFNSNQYDESAKIQKRIENRSNILVYPVLDRFKSEALQELDNEMQKYNLQSPDTVNFGSSLPVIVGKLQDYFFIALIFGSATHIKGTRRLLADVLSKYGLEFEDPYLVIQAIRLYFLNGQTEVGIKLFDKNKRLLFSQFNHEIDDMFSIFDSKYCINNISGRLEFIKNWGQQVNQGNFDKAVRFIYSILEDKDDTNIIGVGAALVVLSKRLKPNQVIELTYKIMKKSHISPIDLGYIPRILVSHNVNEYDTLTFSSRVKELAEMAPKELPFGDFSLVAPAIRELNNPDLLNSVREHSLAMTFNLRLLLDGGNFSEDYLVGLKSTLEKDIEESKQSGISLGGNKNIWCLESAIIGFELSQNDINKATVILVDLLKKAVTGTSFSIILGVLEVMVELLEKIYLNNLNVPEYFKNVGNIYLSESAKKATSIETFARTYRDINSLLLIINYTLLSNDSVWLNVYANSNKYTVKACILAIERDISGNKARYDYIKIWLNSNNAEITLEVIPLAIYLLFCENQVDMLERILGLHTSESIEVRAKVITTLMRYKKYVTTENFQDIIKAFSSDNDWRIRHMASEIRKN